MPKIFLVIDSQMNKCFDGARTEAIAAGMPDGVVQYGQKWVQSQPIQIPGLSASCHIRGRLDTVARFDDGTYGVIDFKTSSRRGEHLPLYSRQLHAYTYALEHAAPGSFHLNPVSCVGLLVFEPTTFSNTGFGDACLQGAMEWIELPRDDEGFLGFLSDVVSLLERPEAPPPSPDCGWCRYREDSRQAGY
jgi:hypothetical protein